MANMAQKRKELCSEFLDAEKKYGECCYQCLDIVDKLYEMACLELESKHRAKSQSMYLKELYKLNAPQQIEDGRKSKKGDYCLLTINPPDTLPYDKLVRSVQQFYDLKVVLWAQYVFEQRGITPDDYHGFHTHILFERNDKPSEVEKAIERIFLPLVPDKAKINIRWMPSKDDVKRSLLYMSGNKKDPSKAPMVDNNAHMRKAYHLEDVYVGGKPILVSLPRPEALGVIPDVD